MITTLIKTVQRPLHLNSRGTPTRCIGFIYCWQTFFLLCLNQKRIRNATTVNTVGNSLKLQEKHTYIVNIQNIHEKILKAVKYRLGILFVNFGTRVMIMNRSRLKCLPTNVLIVAYPERKNTGSSSWL